MSRFAYARGNFAICFPLIRTTECVNELNDVIGLNVDNL